MASTRWDAIVVGGGPAGSATAARLASGGHRVLLLDRADFPRRKPCGECLNPAAVAELEALGALSALRAGSPEPLGGWRISVHGGASFRGRFPSGTPGLAVRREVLDSLLLDHARTAGAEVRAGWRVEDVTREEGVVVGVTGRGDGGEEELRARVVVGADGLRSVVVRRLDMLRRAPRLRKVALTAHLAGPLPFRGHGELRVFPGGCVGVAPLGEGVANATVVVDAARAGELSADPGAFFDRTLESLGIRGPERVEEVLATGPFDWPTRAAVADGALLVGDAAGYYDPFTGQGIFRALKGARLAAGVLDRALRGGDTSRRALRAYDRAQRSAFGPGRALQRLIESVVSRPALLDAAAARLDRAPRAADALVRVAGDLWPVRRLLDPRVLAGLLAR